MLTTAVIALQCSPGDSENAPSTTDELTVIPDPDTSQMQPRVASRIAAARQAVIQRMDAADAWGRLGKVCHVHRLNEEAAVCYRRAHALAPKDFRWPYFLARVLEMEGRAPEQVASFYQTAVELRPDYAPAYVRLGDVQAGRNRTAEARQLYQTAIDLDPTLAKAHRGLGQVLIMLQEPQAAVAPLQRAARLMPNDGAIFAALAQAYAQVNDRPRATSAAQKSRTFKQIHALPDPVMQEVSAEGISSVICFRRAKQLMAAGRYREAILDLKIFAEVNPDHARVHLHLGTAYAHVGQHDEAIAEFSRAASLGTLNASALNNWANALRQKGDLQAAVNRYEEALRLDPEYANAHYNIGVALEKLDRVGDAIMHYQRASQIDPRHPAARRLLQISSDSP